jgi:glycosyltransferase A (GT-A) superfamily protein (DUF2064 family)
MRSSDRVGPLYLNRAETEALQTAVAASIDSLGLAEAIAERHHLNTAMPTGTHLPERLAVLRSLATALAEHRTSLVVGLACPHCESTNLDYGATGLDECNDCGGLSRDGEVLKR